MGEELARLLLLHAALGGSAIVLSATLTQKARAKLVNAFLSGLGICPQAVCSHDYPLTKVVSRERVVETGMGIRPDLTRSVAVTRLTEPQEAVERIVAAATAGAAVAWVRNAIDDVLEAATLLEERDIVPIVFHSRFAMADRLAMEQQIRLTFGPSPASAQARGGQVVVATQGFD